jgi:hypothetical protein
MGAIPASGDLVVVKLLSTCAAEPTINDLSFRIEDPEATWPEQVNAIALALEGPLGTGLGGNWATGRSTAFNTYALQVVDVLPGTSPLLELLRGAQGDLADDCMPPNDSLCVTLRTAVKGRTGRGRMYLNGFPEGSSNGGYWEAAAQDAAVAIAGALLSTFGSPGQPAPYTWGIISRFEFGVKREVPAFTPIDSYTVHNEVRTLRRRAIGVRIGRRPAA